MQGIGLSGRMRAARLRAGDDQLRGHERQPVGLAPGPGAHHEVLPGRPLHQREQLRRQHHRVPRRDRDGASHPRHLPTPLARPSTSRPTPNPALAATVRRLTLCARARRRGSSMGNRRISAMKRLGAAILAVATAVGCGRSGREHAGPPPAMPVEIKTVRAVPLRDASEYVAVLSAAPVGAGSAAGRGARLENPGSSEQSIRTRAELTSMNPSRRPAAITRQRALHAADVASLELARKQFGRMERLFKSGAARPRQAGFDQAQSALLRRRRRWPPPGPRRRAVRRAPVTTASSRPSRARSATSPCGSATW